MFASDNFIGLKRGNGCNNFIGLKRGNGCNSALAVTVDHYLVVKDIGGGVQCCQSSLHCLVLRSHATPIRTLTQPYGKC